MEGIILHFTIYMIIMIGLKYFIKDIIRMYNENENNE